MIILFPYEIKNVENSLASTTNCVNDYPKQQSDKKSCCNVMYSKVIIETPVGNLKKRRVRNELRRYYKNRVNNNQAGEWYQLNNLRLF